MFAKTHQPVFLKWVYYTICKSDINKADLHYVYTYTLFKCKILAMLRIWNIYQQNEYHGIAIWWILYSSKNKPQQSALMSLKVKQNELNWKNICYMIAYFS